MPYATSLWLSISTMIHQSQTVVPLLASSLTDKQLDSIQKNNSPFSDSSEGIQSELVYTVTIWKTQILWVRNIRLKSRATLTKNKIHAKAVPPQTTQNTNPINNRMVSTHGRS